MIEGMERIIFIIIWLVASEALYILFCWEESKETIKREWIQTKLGSMFGGFIVTGILLIIYEGFKNYTKISFIVLGSIIGVMLFFYINYKLGLSVAKKPRKRTSHSRTKEKK